MHILISILLGSAPYVQLPAGDYSICNKDTRECIEVSGGHAVTVESQRVVVPERAVVPAVTAPEPTPANETERAPRGLLLAGGVTTAASFEGRAALAFGGGTWFIEPRVAVRRVEHDDFGWSQELTEIDLGAALGLDSGSRPWFFALAVDVGLVLPGGDDGYGGDIMTNMDVMPSIVRPSDDPGVNAGVLARVGYALGEVLFVAVDAQVGVALVEHRGTREKVMIGLRAGLGFSF